MGDSHLLPWGERRRQAGWAAMERLPGVFHEWTA